MLFTCAYSTQTPAHTQQVVSHFWCLVVSESAEINTGGAESGTDWSKAGHWTLHLWAASLVMNTLNKPVSRQFPCTGLFSAAVILYGIADLHFHMKWLSAHSSSSRSRLPGWHVLDITLHRCKTQIVFTIGSTTFFCQRLFIYFFHQSSLQFSSHELLVWFSPSWCDRWVPQPKIREPFWNHCPFNTYPKWCGNRLYPT